MLQLFPTLIVNTWYFKCFKTADGPLTKLPKLERQTLFPEKKPDVINILVKTPNANQSVE